MSYKILESIGVENENIDGASLNYLIASGKDLILKGVLNECSVAIYTATSISIDTGVLMIQGFRVKIESPIILSTALTAESVSRQVVAKLIVGADRSVSFEVTLRDYSDILIQENIMSLESGVYEVVLATFKTSVSGISDLKQLISVSSDVKSAYEYAVDGGYEGSESDFSTAFANLLNVSTAEGVIFGG